MLLRSYFFIFSGQKGIGFKSVFRVTDAPEVHSNGFHIKFDVNSGPMGYILPHWITDTDLYPNDRYICRIVLFTSPLFWVILLYTDYHRGSLSFC